MTEEATARDEVNDAQKGSTVMEVILQEQPSNPSCWEALTESEIGSVKQTEAYNVALAKSSMRKCGKSGLVLATVGGDLIGGCAFAAIPSAIPFKSYKIIDDGPLVLDEDTRTEITETIIKTVTRLNPGFFCPGILVKDSLGQIGPDVVKALGLHTYVGGCTFRVNLRKTEEELWRSLRQNARRGVRKAMLEGYHAVTDTKGDFLEAFSEILRATMERGGEHYWQESILAAYRKHMFPAGLARLQIVLTDRNEVAEGALVLCDPNKHRLYYYFAASSSQLRGRWAGDLLVWEIIKRGASEGYSTFDLGGVPCSPRPGTKTGGIFSFKSKWGGTFVHEYHHVNMAYLLSRKLGELPLPSHLKQTAERITKLVTAR
ncbi:MAG: GNAT family N-acetyltransferase [Candidatus Bathyarchaeia archaeon]